MQHKKQQTYNDGMVNIYAVSSDAAAGDSPTEKLTIKETLPYEERVVGLIRYMAAKQDGVEIKRILRCPCRLTVSPQDIAVPLVDGENDPRYRIIMVQPPMDVTPASMDLTLEEVTVVYEV